MEVDKTEDRNSCAVVNCLTLAGFKMGFRNVRPNPSGEASTLFALRPAAERAQQVVRGLRVT
jgi:hypothetical protein